MANSSLSREATGGSFFTIWQRNRLWPMSKSPTHLTGTKPGWHSRGTGSFVLCRRMGSCLPVECWRSSFHSQAPEKLRHRGRTIFGLVRDRSPGRQARYRYHQWCRGTLGHDGESTDRPLAALRSSALARLFPGWTNARHRKPGYRGQAVRPCDWATNNFSSGTPQLCPLRSLFARWQSSGCWGRRLGAPVARPGDWNRHSFENTMIATLLLPTSLALCVPRLLSARITCVSDSSPQTSLIAVKTQL
jgi:hypothetical protein